MNAKLKQAQMHDVFYKISVPLCLSNLQEMQIPLGSQSSINKGAEFYLIYFISKR